MGTRRTDDLQRQVEERLAVLLRPGPRRARLPPEGDPDVEDTLIGDRPPSPAVGDADPVAGQQKTSGWLDEELDREEHGLDRDKQELDREEQGLDREVQGDSDELEVFEDPAPVRNRMVRVVGGLWRLLPIGSFAGFGRQQLAVIGVIIALGALFGGWAVLRARPVAIGAPRLTTTTGSASNRVVKSSASTSTQPTASSPRPTSSPSAVGADPVNPTTGETIRVHVLGAVHKPGVVSLTLGARVQDAIRRAGGTKRSARLGDLNLAQPLSDGQQVFVGHGARDSEVRNPTAGPPAGSGGEQATGSAQPTEPIDLNTATLDQLDTLPGVGPVTAQKILDWRSEHGKFSSIDELQEVAGIGPKTFADLKSAVRV